MRKPFLILCLLPLLTMIAREAEAIHVTAQQVRTLYPEGTGIGRRMGSRIDGGIGSGLDTEALFANWQRAEAFLAANEGLETD